MLEGMKSSSDAPGRNFRVVVTDAEEAVLKGLSTLKEQVDSLTPEGSDALLLDTLLSTLEGVAVDTRILAATLRDLSSQKAADQT